MSLYWKSSPLWKELNQIDKIKLLDNQNDYAINSYLKFLT